MEKEKIITAPNGCEIEKVELVDGAAVVTFREKKRKLPKSWEEFCETFPIKDGECYVSSSWKIEEYLYHRDIPRAITDKNHLPDRSTAEAVLALCQLIQLRNVYNGDWVPDWTNDETKWMILFSKNTIETTTCTYVTASELYFKTKELCDEFLLYFRPLIEKLKPLYGIKEGGEK